MKIKIQLILNFNTKKVKCLFKEATAITKKEFMVIATDDFKMFSINNLSNEVQHFSSAQKCLSHLIQKKKKYPAEFLC